MKTYFFKIRDKFIDIIKKEIKKHEYRLGTQENRNIKVGDYLLLISNQNKNNYVKVTVKNIIVYENWNDALTNNWKNDFGDIFDSLDETIKECQKFYTRDEVKQNGIICFDITPVRIDYLDASVLLDTNIIIKRESMNNTSFEVAKLFNWFDKIGIKKYIHHLSSIELSKYQYENCKNSIKTKLFSYDELPKYEKNDDYYFDSIISQFSLNENDKIDNELLREIYNDNVDILLTDDKLILQKAELLYLRDRVLSSVELLQYYESYYPNKVEYDVLSVKLKYFSEVDLNSNFFDSLREDYEGQKFDKWFRTKANSQEKAYVFEDNGQLRGFLYLKFENEKEKYPDITPKMEPKNRLKIGTFKVLRTGFKLGERFLKIVFDNAVKQNVDEIYVTLFENKREEVGFLKELMEKWGFYKFGVKDNGEIILVKEMKSYNCAMDPKYNFPIEKPDKNYYILPIYPKYHTDLFPDNILKNEDMHLYEDNLAHRYSIEKIYLSGAYNINAKPGDFILIYRTGDYKPKKYTSVISGIAILQDIIYCKNNEDLLRICKDRSVFTKEEILSFKEKYKTVVKLLHYITFDRKVILDHLIKMGIVDNYSGPRPFTKITKEQYEKIYEIGMSKK